MYHFLTLFWQLWKAIISNKNLIDPGVELFSAWRSSWCMPAQISYLCTLCHQAPRRKVSPSRSRISCRRCANLSRATSARVWWTHRRGPHRVDLQVSTFSLRVVLIGQSSKHIKLAANSPWKACRWIIFQAIKVPKLPPAPKLPSARSTLALL